MVFSYPIRKASVSWNATSARSPSRRSDSATGRASISASDISAIFSIARPQTCLRNLKGCFPRWKISGELIPAPVRKGRNQRRMGRTDQCAIYLREVCGDFYENRTDQPMKISASHNMNGKNRAPRLSSETTCLDNVKI